MGRRLLCVDGKTRPHTGTCDRPWYPVEGQVYTESWRGEDPWENRPGHSRDACVTLIEDTWSCPWVHTLAPDGRAPWAADRFVDITDFAESESTAAETEAETTCPA